MHRILVAALGATAFSVAVANAAELPVKAPIVAPIIRYNWTGCYIGGHAGGAWARVRMDQHS